MGGRVLNYEVKDILHRGIRQGCSQGVQQGIQQGIQALIATRKKLGADFELTSENVREQFQLSDAEVLDSMKRYW